MNDRQETTYITIIVVAACIIVMLVVALAIAGGNLAKQKRHAIGNNCAYYTPDTGKFRWGKLENYTPERRRLP